MRRTGVLLVAVTMLIAAAMVAYAHWTDTLAVDAQVDTGTLDIEWDFVSCSEFYGWPENLGAGEVEGKDVGSTTWQTVGDALEVTVTNGYPSYSADCEIEFNNVGSVPVIIHGWRFTPGANLTGCEVEVTTGGSLLVTCTEMTMIVVDGVGTQIDPNALLGSASSLRFHIEQAAAQSAVYEWMFEVCVVNRNEYDSQTPCFPID